MDTRVSASTIIKTLSVLVLLLTISACTTNRYVNSPAEDHERFRCAIEEDICGIQFSVGHVAYKVHKIADNKYRTVGEVRFNPDATGDLHVTFYMLFMDDKQVVFERRVKTATADGTFDFEVETPKPVTASTLANVRLMIRS
ncbi:hypothetical protein [Hahella ganghwensis]|uniref:hypothetical protein n=1 Tax=Hahella ganghwensis TaxID=286420 RepID=UPI0003746417|nr:hypothetical protein [Hahella ganghwensis]